MAETDLLTFAEYCLITGTKPEDADQEQIEALIAAVTAHLELVLNCTFVQREYTEPHRPPPRPQPYPILSNDPVPLPLTLVLHRQPVQTVVQIADMAGVVLAAETYRLIPGLAIIERQGGWGFPDG